MSAFDPKRTLHDPKPHSVLTSKNTIRVGAHETAGLSRHSRLRGGLAGRTEGAIDRPDTHCWDAQHSRSGRSGGESTGRSVGTSSSAVRVVPWPRSENR